MNIKQAVALSAFSWVLSGCGSALTVLQDEADVARDLRKQKTYCQSIPRIYSGLAYDFCVLNAPPDPTGFLVPFVLLVNGWTKGDWTEAFLFALSVAVGLTPEMLPMIVSANLAKGAVAMAKRKVVVKRLNAIQNFGSMDVLCTDKTGTLTQDKIILEHHIDVDGKRDAGVLELAWLNSYHQSGMKNLMDQAVVQFSEQNPKFQVPFAYSKVDELPFDFVRRRLSIVVKDAAEKADVVWGV